MLRCNAFRPYVAIFLLLRSFEAEDGDLVRYVKAAFVEILYLDSRADREIIERALGFVFYDNLRICRDGECLGKS
jgi:hypothetical protein